MDALQRLARETVDGVIAWQPSAEDYCAVEAVEFYGRGPGVLVLWSQTTPTKATVGSASWLPSRNSRVVLPRTSEVHENRAVDDRATRPAVRAAGDASRPDTRIWFGALH